MGGIREALKEWIGKSWGWPDVCDHRRKLCCFSPSTPGRKIRMPEDGWLCQRVTRKCDLLSQLVLLPSMRKNIPLPQFKVHQQISQPPSKHPWSEPGQMLTSLSLGLLLHGQSRFSPAISKAPSCSKIWLFFLSRDLPSKITHEITFKIPWRMDN